MLESMVFKYENDSIIIDVCINEMKTWQASDTLIKKREARYIEFDNIYCLLVPDQRTNRSHVFLHV